MEASVFTLGTCMFDVCVCHCSVLDLTGLHTHTHTHTHHTQWGKAVAQPGPAAVLTVVHATGQRCGSPEGPKHWIGTEEPHKEHWMGPGGSWPDNQYPSHSPVSLQLCLLQLFSSSYLTAPYALSLSVLQLLHAYQFKSSVASGVRWIAWVLQTVAIA